MGEVGAYAGEVGGNSYDGDGGELRRGDPSQESSSAGDEEAVLGSNDEEGESGG